MAFISCNMQWWLFGLINSIFKFRVFIWLYKLFNSLNISPWAVNKQRCEFIVIKFSHPLNIKPSSLQSFDGFNLIFGNPILTCEFMKYFVEIRCEYSYCNFFKCHAFESLVNEWYTFLRNFEITYLTWSFDISWSIAIAGLFYIIWN